MNPSIEQKEESTTKALIDHFKAIILLNNHEKQLVTHLFKPRLYRKRQYTLQQGDMCRNINFVVRGCLRMYKIDDKGNMHIVQFAAEGEWITDIGSFYSHTPLTST